MRQHTPSGPVAAMAARCGFVRLSMFGRRFKRAHQVKETIQSHASEHVVVLLLVTAVESAGRFHTVAEAWMPEPGLYVRPKRGGD
jgi:AraC-like DNA-binding protein